MDFVLRSGQADDARAIAIVQVESWRSTYTGIVPQSFLDGLIVEVQTARWLEWLNTGETSLFVVEDDGGVFGFSSGGRVREPLKHYDAELYAIYLLQSKQRKGAGLALVRALANALSRREFSSMLVWVLEQNPAASFYKRLGATAESRKLIAIGDAELPEVAYGWESLTALIHSRS